MWFGTWNGLCRYDGYRFKVYQTIPGDSTSIGNSRVHYIFKDKEQTLWIATFNSYICRYNYETDDFTRFKVNQVPQHIRDSTNRLNSVLNIQRHQEMLERHIGAFTFSENQEHIIFRQPVQLGNSLSNNHINTIYYDDQNLLWLGTTKGGLNKVNLQANKFERHIITHSQGLTGENAVRALWSGQKGTWVGTQDDGLFFVDGLTNRSRKINHPFVSENIRAVLQDSRGKQVYGILEDNVFENACIEVSLSKRLKYNQVGWSITQTRINTKDGFLRKK